MNKSHIIISLCIGTAFGYILSTTLQVNKATDDLILKGPIHLEEEIDLVFDNNSFSEQKSPPISSSAKTNELINPLINSASDTHTGKNNDDKLSYQALEQKYRQLLHENMLFEQQLASLEQTTITNEQMAALVDNNFSNTLKYLHGKLRNDVYNFHQRDEDLDWGYIMSNNIINFISTHYQGVDIEIDSIRCKHPHCELRLIEKEASSWQKVSQDMYQQPWWTFISNNSSTTIDPTQNDTLVYAFIKSSE